MEENISINENNINDVNNTVENSTSNTIENTVNYNDNLQTIHEDLGVICSFLIFFTLVIILKYIYKWFDMFFKI